MQEKKSFFELINMQIFVGPAVALIAFISWGVFFPENFNNVSNAMIAFVCKYFTWFMAPAVTFMFFFCLWAAFSKYGNIRLGGANAKPRLSFIKWFSITLTAGTGAGLCFFGAYQPIQVFNNMPAFETASSLTEKVYLAFEWTYQMWCIHTYSIYTVCGLAIAFIYYNTKRKYNVSEMFYGLVGDKCDGTFGKVVDSLSIYLLVIGVAVTMGYSTLQTSRGLDVIFGIPSSPKTWLLVLIGFTIVYTGAAVTGIEKAVAFISEANMYLYYWIAIWAFVFVDPLNVMGLVFTTAANYLHNLIPLSFELEPVTQSGWISANPIFIYCWWALFAPIMGMFLIKLAYGRTIREFVFTNLIAPVLFSFVWFSWLGGCSIFIDVFKGGKIYESIASVGSDVALYVLCDYLPWPSVMKIVSFFVVVLSFITLGQALAVAIAAMTTKGYADEDGLTKPPSVLVVFWACIMGALTYILLATGGMAALQACAVTWGFPILIVMCFLMYGYVKVMMNLKVYDKTGDYHYLNMDPAILMERIAKELPPEEEKA